MRKLFKHLVGGNIFGIADRIKEERKPRFPKKKFNKKRR